MMKVCPFENIYTVGPICRAPIEFNDVLSTCGAFGFELSEPVLVQTSFGMRIMREIEPVIDFWQDRNTHAGVYRKIGVVLSKEGGAWVARLWTKPDKQKPLPKLPIYDPAAKSRDVYEQAVRRQRQDTASR